MERLVQTSRDLTRGLKAGFDWWLEQLTTLIPEPVRAFLDRRSWLEAHVGSGLEIWRASRRSRSRLGTIATGVSAAAAPLSFRPVFPVVLVPRPGDVFVREVRLPRSALRHLETVAEAQFQTWTPFAATEVLRLIRLVRMIDDRQMVVEVRFVMKSDLEGPTALLRAYGLGPERVALGEIPDRSSWVRFDARERSLDQYLRLSLQLATAAALALAVWFHVVALDRRKMDLEARVAALSARLRPAPATRERLAVIKALQESARAAAAGAETARAIVEIGDRMPAADWLSKIEVEGRTVSVEGVTTSREAFAQAVAGVTSLRGIGEPRLEPGPRAGTHRFIQVFERWR